MGWAAVRPGDNIADSSVQRERWVLFPRAGGERRSQAVSDFQRFPFKSTPVRLAYRKLISEMEHPELRAALRLTD